MRRTTALPGLTALVLTIVLAFPQPAWPGARHSLTVMSDTSGMWVNHFNNRSGGAVLTYGNIGCSGVDTRGFCTGGA